ncbi:hypothetical protein [Mycolicibacterium vaccae]|uniref:hypothetical protein n=1 Tax=Mycolicibacterium vaccae TaxID=1810 RepID=UPI003D080194
MATLHSLMALYGALDDAVVALDDRRVTATVEEFLPGSTPPEHRGWFSEIRSLVRRLSVDPDQTEFPTRTAALREFAEMGERGDNLDGDVLGPVELSRLLYVIGAHWQLASRPREEQELFAGALSVAIPRTSDIETGAGGEALLELFGESFLNTNTFADIITAAEAQGLVSEELLHYVLNSSLYTDIRRDACGEYAVLESEYFREQLSLNNVKAVVDPRNWPDCCPFFCDMAPIPTTPDSYGWSRLLESVSTLCGLFPGYRLRTALKFWKGEKPGGGFINYDLDDDRANTTDIGFAVVDRGYVSFEQDQGGVRIRTLKEVKFAGISAFATLMFARIGGYAAIGENMLVGCALNPQSYHQPWQISAGTGKPYAAVDPTKCSSPAVPAPCGCDTSIHPAVAEAVGMWTDCVTEVSTEYATLVNRWAKCGFDASEFADFGSKVSARLATDPFRIWSHLLNSGAAKERP